MAGGRPTIMGKETIDKLEYAFSIGCSDLEACLHANISKQTLYNYQDKHPEFVDRKERLKENPIFKARLAVFSKLDDDADLSLKFLERKRKDEFSLKQDVNLGGQKDNPIQISLPEDDKALVSEWLKQQGLKK